MVLWNTVRGDRLALGRFASEGGIREREGAVIGLLLETLSVVGVGHCGVGANYGHQLSELGKISGVGSGIEQHERVPCTRRRRGCGSPSAVLGCSPEGAKSQRAMINVARWAKRTSRTCWPNVRISVSLNARFALIVFASKCPASIASVSKFRS
jgi:hypothetical protein